MSLSCDEEALLALGSALAHATRNLPEGYSIELSAATYGYSVLLRKPDCTIITCCQEGVVDEIEELVAHAVNYAKDNNA